MKKIVDNKKEYLKDINDFYTGFDKKLNDFMKDNDLS